jgi:hypothetical protein
MGDSIILACEECHLCTGYRRTAQTFKIFKIDPKTGEVLGSIHLPDGRHMGIAFVGDHIWLVDGLSRLFRKVDPTTGEIAKEIQL